jgi:hypothetical protein
MLTALVTAIFGAVQRFAPEWRHEPLIMICVLVALEAGFVHYVARVDRLSFSEFARYLAPELFILAVLMRIASAMSVPPYDLNLALQEWLYDPISALDGIFVGYFLTGLTVGLFAHLSMRDITELMPMPGEHVPSGEGHRRYAAVLAVDRAEALSRIGRRFGMGGVLLLLALAAEVVNIEQPRGPAMPISATSAAAALIYLVSGFLLYSQARFEVLQIRWSHEGAHVAARVAQRWRRASIIITLGGVLLAALLPRSYGMGLLDTLRYALGIVGYAIAMIGYLLVWLFSMLVALPAWLLSLLLPTGGVMPPPPPAAPPPPPPVVAEQEPRLLAALIFWLCMLLLVGYAINILLRRHPGLLQRLLTVSYIERLITWLREVWRDSSGWLHLGATTLQQMFQSPPPAASATPPRRRRAGNLPDAVIRYLYLSLLDHAARRGAGRRAGQTPNEYRSALAPRLSDVQSELDGLTEAFNIAQYSRRSIATREVVAAQRWWIRLRRALRRLQA